MENPKIPVLIALIHLHLDQVQGVLKRDPRRIEAGFALLGYNDLYEYTSVLEFLSIWYEARKIQSYRCIELIGLHLEPGWNSWDMFLNEYGKDLLEYGANFTDVNNDEEKEKSKL
jgi:hypothetical protein